MSLLVLFVGLIIAITTLRNTQGQLASALMTDVPHYISWAAAIVATGAIGFIPGMKGTSRALLALILVVIILRNYQKIITGLTNASKGAVPSAAPPTPGQQLSQSAAQNGVAWAGLNPGTTISPDMSNPNTSPSLAVNNPIGAAGFGLGALQGFGGSAEFTSMASAIGAFL